MENQLQVSNHNLSTPLQPKEKEIAQIIWHVNLLMNYPLTDFQIESWSRSINELRPNQDLSILTTVINMMKMGSIDFNPRLGIQNIFLALKKYDRIKIGYVERESQNVSRNRLTNMYESVLEKYFYFEDEDYPDTMVWMVDKAEYEKYHLKESFIPEYNYLNGL